MQNHTFFTLQVKCIIVSSFLLKVDWSFGASRTYVRQFYKKKYGYSGAYMFYVVGSSKSTMPISFGAAMTSTRSDSYKMMMGSAHFR